MAPKKRLVGDDGEKHAPAVGNAQEDEYDVGSHVPMVDKPLCKAVGLVAANYLTDFTCKLFMTAARVGLMVLQHFQQSLGASCISYGTSKSGIFYMEMDFPSQIDVVLEDVARGVGTDKEVTKTAMQNLISLAKAVIFMCVAFKAAYLIYPSEQCLDVSKDEWLQIFKSALSRKKQAIKECALGHIGNLANCFRRMGHGYGRKGANGATTHKARFIIPCALAVAEHIQEAAKLPAKETTDKNNRRATAVLGEEIEDDSECEDAGNFAANSRDLIEKAQLKIKRQAKQIEQLKLNASKEQKQSKEKINRLTEKVGKRSSAYMPPFLSHDRKLTTVM